MKLYFYLIFYRDISQIITLFRNDDIFFVLLLINVLFEDKNLKE